MVEGAGSPACFAPFSGLYFEPNGAIRVCCTSKLVIGTWVPGRTRLRDVWDGATAAALRDAMHAQDFSYGCMECEADIERGGRAASLAVHFDRFGPAVAPTLPKLIDFALSNRCNLACVMCNGELSSTIRAQRDHLPPLPAVYGDDFFEQLRELLPHTERLQFKGGEPFLQPEARRVWDLLLELDHRPEVAVTTNATVWNERVDTYVRDLQMEVNASVDGMEAATLEALRQGTVATAVWANIDRFQAAAESTGKAFTLSFCLMPQNWREVGRFLQECERRGAFANVIVVNQPEAWSLPALPPVELATVIAGLEAEDERLRSELRSTLGEWTRVLARVRGLGGAPVELRRTIRPSRNVDLFSGQAMDPADVRARIAALQAEHGTPPLVLQVDGEVVDAVASTPRWAVALAPERWVGGPVSDLPAHLEPLTGPLTPAALRRVDGGGFEATLFAHEGEDRREAVRSYGFPPAPGASGRGLIAIFALGVPAEP